MQTDSYIYKTLKNISYSFVGFLWPMIFAIFVTPLVVNRLGVETYGVFIFVNTISSMLGILDLGVATAMTKFISEYSAVGDESDIKKTMYSCNSIFLVIGILGLLIFLVFGFLGKKVLGPGFPDQSVAMPLFLLSGLSFLVNTLSALFYSLPQTLQRFDVGTKVGMVKIALSSLLMLALVLAGYGLFSIFAMTLALDFIFSIISQRVARKLLPYAKLKFIYDPIMLKRLYGFGLGTFVGNMANSLLYQFDRILIPIFLGPAALSYYSLPGSVTTKIQSINGSLSAVLMPLSSSLNGQGDKAAISKLYIRAFRLLTIVAAGITTTIIVFSYHLLRYWLNEDFAQKSRGVLIILSLTYFVLSLSSPLVQFLLGLSRVKLVAVSAVVMATINIILLFLLVPPFGIVGAAWAFLLAVLPSAYLFYFVENRILDLKGRAIMHLRGAIKIAATSFVFWALISFMILPLVHSKATLIVAGVGSTMFYFILYRVFGFFEAEDWLSFKDFGKIAVAKVKISKA